MTFLQHLLTSITSVIRLKTCTLDSLHEIKNITVQVISVFCFKYLSVQYVSKLSILNSHINFSLPFSEHLLLVGLDYRIFFQYRRLGLQIYNLWMGCFCKTLERESVPLYLLMVQMLMLSSVFAYIDF